MKTKPKYTAAGIVLGASLGTVLGVWAGHIALWLGIGVAIGMVLGATVRLRANDCPECEQSHRAHRVKSSQLGARS